MANINGEIQQTETDFLTEAVAGSDGKNSALATEVQKLTETNAHKVKEAQNMKKQRTLQTKTNEESPKKLTDYLDGTKAISLAVAILKQNLQPLNEFTQTHHHEITTLFNSLKEQINNFSAAFDIEKTITDAVGNEQETEFVYKIADEFQKRKGTEQKNVSEQHDATMPLGSAKPPAIDDPDRQETKTLNKNADDFRKSNATE